MAKKPSDYTKTDGSIREKKLPRPVVGSKWMHRKTNVIVKIAPHQFFNDIMFEGGDNLMDLQEFYHDYVKVDING